MLVAMQDSIETTSIAAGLKYIVVINEEVF